MFIYRLCISCTSICYTLLKGKVISQTRMCQLYAYITWCWRARWFDRPACVSCTLILHGDEGQDDFTDQTVSVVHLYYMVMKGKVISQARLCQLYAYITWCSRARWFHRPDCVSCTPICHTVLKGKVISQTRLCQLYADMSHGVEGQGNFTDRTVSVVHLYYMVLKGQVFSQTRLCQLYAYITRCWRAKCY